MRVLCELGDWGPLVAVVVDNPPAWKRMLAEAGQGGESTSVGLPEAISCLALLDTGATRSVILPEVASTLQAMKGAARSIRGVSPKSPWQSNDAVSAATSMVRIMIPSADVFSTVEATTCHFPLADDHPEVRAILGRDIIDLLRFVYDGPRRRLVLADDG